MPRRRSWESGGGERAQKLVAFYAAMRKKLIEAQARKSPEMLEEQMEIVLSIRGTWQDLETRASNALEAPQRPQPQSYPGAPPALNERSTSSWSA